MKKFSDLGIKADENKAIFQVEMISITDVINCEIEVIDYTPGITTMHGDGRYILKVRFKNEECKFFTNAKPIKEMLDKVNKTDFPFITTIKPLKYGKGNNKTYQFT